MAVSDNFIPLSDHEFQLIAKLVYDRYGINLTEKKKTLVVSRLNKVLKEGGFATFKEYYEHLLNDKSGQSLITFINRISTNLTYFFREEEHFDFLQKTILPGVVQKGTKRLRVWCAGCSTGEEPYTIAMVVRDFLKEDYKNWDVGILATDISTNVLEKAIKGIYDDEKVKKIPPMLKQTYFTRLSGKDWSVNKLLREMILFRRLNLIQPNYPFKGKFDVIFCRNVMIYFDLPTREALVNRYFSYTQPGGYLLVGHSESLSMLKCPYQFVQPATYRKEEK